tara:strand:- start:9091 stop:9438 length:348 start_codon:yes stop_codon:yes gene_type:complete
MFISLIIICVILLLLKIRSSKFKKNKKIIKFRNDLISKESKIEKIFSRNNEKISQDPSINITIGLYEKDENISIKSNIHRSRLARFNKSKLNGEYIYMDEEKNIYKFINGEKIFL